MCSVCSTCASYWSCTRRRRNAFSKDSLALALLAAFEDAGAPAKLDARLLIAPVIRRVSVIVPISRHQIGARKAKIFGVWPGLTAGYTASCPDRVDSAVHIDVLARHARGEVA